MFASLKIAVVRAFIKEEIAKLEASLVAVADKVKDAEPKLAADVQPQMFSLRLPKPRQSSPSTSWKQSLKSPR